ncbi:MAG: hypothetical protein P857_383 [Candidatus Xenolissoclinum pacificiensis L6]|uniref:Uncharacterized protein n=1 Tax=Candidatus Xenolissoclinum pacificiensis L6 TaxID=1401685 RepID=W2V1Z0_9RICK|nr:MAG: hypothetical protein P857_383 [Candidatus Xenolissoclinum pacificiensis L6]
MHNNIQSELQETTLLMFNTIGYLIRESHEIDNLRSSSSINAFLNACHEKILHKIEQKIPSLSIGSKYKIEIFPIDTKTNFIHGLTDFCCMITLSLNGTIHHVIIGSPALQYIMHIKNDVIFTVDQNMQKKQIKHSSIIGDVLVATNVTETQLPKSFADIKINYRVTGTILMDTIHTIAGRYNALLYFSPIIPPYIEVFKLIAQNTKYLFTLNENFILLSTKTIHNPLINLLRNI